MAVTPVEARERRKVPDALAPGRVEVEPASGVAVAADVGSAVGEAVESPGSPSVVKLVQHDDEEVGSAGAGVAECCAEVELLLPPDAAPPVGPRGIVKLVPAEEIHEETTEEMAPGAVADSEGREIGTVGTGAGRDARDDPDAVEPCEDDLGGRGGSVRVMTDGLATAEETQGTDDGSDELGEIVTSGGDDGAGEGTGQMVTQEASAAVAVGPGFGRVRERASGTGFQVVRVTTDGEWPAVPGIVYVSTSSVNEMVMAVTWAGGYGVKVPWPSRVPTLDGLP